MAAQNEGFRPGQCHHDYIDAYGRVKLEHFWANILLDKVTRHAPPSNREAIF